MATDCEITAAHTFFSSLKALESINIYSAKLVFHATIGLDIAIRFLESDLATLAYIVEFNRRYSGGGRQLLEHAQPRG